MLKPGDGELSDNYANRWWRIQNLYKIRDKNKNLCNLRFNNIQLAIIRDIIKALKEKRPIRSFDLKYRQGGVSTFWLLFWLDDTIYTPNTVTGILADKHENLRKLMKIIQVAHKYMPPRLQPRLLDDSKEKLSFAATDSEIFASLSIRSTVLHNLHISEWCFCADDEIRATIGACSPSTNISGESTGNGIGNDGYETYMDAKNGASGLIEKARFSPWFIQPEYTVDLRGQDPKRIMQSLSVEERKLQKLMKEQWRMTLQPGQLLWRRGTHKALKHMAPQEFPETDQDAFLASGSMFFDGKKIQVLYDEARAHWNAQEPYAVDDKRDYWTQFFPPEKNHVYALGADPSEGANDPGVIKIIDVTDPKEVFLFRALVNVATFYREVAKWGRLYNDALAGIERNNHGHAVILGLQEKERYANLYYDKMGEPPTRVPLDKPIRRKYGWDTNNDSRPRMLDHLKMALEGDPMDELDVFQPAFGVYDKNLLSEALTFKEIDGKYEAVPGKTDDDVMATAIAYQMFKLLQRHRTVSSHNAYHIGGQRVAV